MGHRTPTIGYHPPSPTSPLFFSRCCTPNILCPLRHSLHHVYLHCRVAFLLPFFAAAFLFFFLLVAHSLHDWLSVGTDSNIFNCLFCFSFCPCPTPAVLHYLPQSFLTLTSASSVLPSCSQ